MKRLFELLIVIGTALLSQAAFSQQTKKAEFTKRVRASVEKFSKSTGIVVTKGVSQKILSAGPPNANRVRRSRRRWRSGRRRRRSRNAYDFWSIPSWGFDYWSKLKIRGLLRKYPVISVVVTPVPPMDYVVRINGEPYPATEKSQYAVAPGHVALKIERPGHKSCERSVDINKNETITCDFSETDETSPP